MRALIISAALFVSVVLCILFLVIFGGFALGATALLAMGSGIFMVAVLFAAISALGPKYRPTPVLTPAMAGSFAAVLITLFIIVGDRQTSLAQRGTTVSPAQPTISRPATIESSPLAVVPTVQDPIIRSVRSVDSTPVPTAENLESGIPPQPAAGTEPADNTLPTTIVTDSPIDSAVTDTPIVPADAPAVVAVTPPPNPVRSGDAAVASPNGPMVLVPLDASTTATETPAPAGASPLSNPAASDNAAAGAPQGPVAVVSPDAPIGDVPGLPPETTDSLAAGLDDFDSSTPEAAAVSPPLAPASAPLAPISAPLAPISAPLAPISAPLAPVSTTATIVTPPRPRIRPCGAAGQPCP